MNYSYFKNWLLNNKKFTERSSKDVISRYKRVCKILQTEEITKESIIKLSKMEEFNKNSTFIRSQLKRAISLYLEYSICEEENLNEKI